MQVWNEPYFGPNHLYNKVSLSVPEPAVETESDLKAAEEPQQSPFQVEIEKLEGVLSTIINMYQDELKICKQIQPVS